jgi:hypothetical protein
VLVSEAFWKVFFPRHAASQSILISSGACGLPGRRRPTALELYVPSSEAYYHDENDDAQMI